MCIRDSSKPIFSGITGAILQNQVNFFDELLRQSRFWEMLSVAMSLSKVIGANQRGNGYMEGNGYLVSWCVGHLVELSQPEAYDEKYARWRYDDLSILPEHWQYQVSVSTKKQFGILKKLMQWKDVESLVCATDAGREGELIFRLVYHQCGCKKTGGTTLDFLDGGQCDPGRLSEAQTGNRIGCLSGILRTGISAGLIFAACGRRVGHPVQTLSEGAISGYDHQSHRLSWRRPWARAVYSPLSR